MKIRKFPDPILRKRAQNVACVTSAEKKILTGMAEVMYLKGGVGLAAVQVGIDKQLAVIDIGDGLIKLINPVVIKKEGSMEEEEGCLSVPGLQVKIKRAKNVIVNFLDEDGRAIQLKATGLFARAVQHEIDHLSGKLIIDYLNPIKKIFIKKRMLNTETKG